MTVPFMVSEEQILAVLHSGSILPVFHGLFNCGGCGMLQTFISDVMGLQIFQNFLSVIHCLMIDGFGGEAYIQKKLIVSRQPTLVNLKSNTMKNTMQSYAISDSDTNKIGCN